jgi:hypothetical protein
MSGSTGMLWNLQTRTMTSLCLRSSSGSVRTLLVSFVPDKCYTHNLYYLLQLIGQQRWQIYAWLGRGPCSRRRLWSLRSINQHESSQIAPSMADRPTIVEGIHDASAQAWFPIEAIPVEAFTAAPTLGTLACALLSPSTRHYFFMARDSRWRC